MRAAGKAPKTILIAAGRQLRVIINAMIRSQQPLRLRTKHSCPPPRAPSGPRGLILKYPSAQMLPPPPRARAERTLQHLKRHRAPPLPPRARAERTAGARVAERGQARRGSRPGPTGFGSGAGGAVRGVGERLPPGRLGPRCA